MKLKEGFQSSSQSVDDTIRRSINTIYNADIDAMRNLSSIASQLTTSNYLRLAGNLVVDRNITTSSLNTRSVNIGTESTSMSMSMSADTMTIGNYIMHTGLNNLYISSNTLNLGNDVPGQRFYEGIIIDSAGKVITNKLSNKDVLDTKTLTVTGNISCSGDINMTNGKKLYFGSIGGSYIYDNGPSGDLQITTDDNLRLNATNTHMTGNLNMANTIIVNTSSVANTNKGFIEAHYGTDNDRYGIGQGYNGQMRMYASTLHEPAQVCLSFTTLTGFIDVLTAKKNGDVAITGTVTASTISGNVIKTNSISCTNEITCKSIKIGNWKIAQGDNGYLSFVKDDVITWDGRSDITSTAAVDQPMLSIASNGDIYINRMGSIRGWISGFSRKIKSIGAILIDGSNTNYGIAFSTTYSSLGMNEKDDHYVIMPYFKLVVYENYEYTGWSVVYDNTTGIQPRYCTVAGVHQNKGSACKLYFSDVEVNEVTVTS